MLWGRLKFTGAREKPFVRSIPRAHCVLLLLAVPLHHETGKPMKKERNETMCGKYFYKIKIKKRKNILNTNLSKMRNEKVFFKK
jgi:hypothetical protein